MTKRTTIDPKKNGPYLVAGCEDLRGVTEGSVYPSEGTIALCRCGGSKNKPFCDGTHAKVGFEDAKAADRVPDRRDNYVGDGITIHDNRGICAHAARCTDHLAEVFRLKQEPWIDPSGDQVQNSRDHHRTVSVGGSQLQHGRRGAARSGGRTTNRGGAQRPLPGSRGRSARERKVG